MRLSSQLPFPKMEKKSWTIASRDAGRSRNDLNIHDYLGLAERPEKL
jgi:hypothetical protein